MFDPADHKPTKDRKDSPESIPLKKAGRFLIACRYVAPEYKLSTNNNPFVRTYFEVIHGDEKGKSFREDVFVHERAWARLGSMANAIGFKKRFDPEKDLKTLADMLLFRPFSGKIKTKNGSDGKVYANLAFSDPAEGDEIAICKAYMKAVAEDRAEKLEKLFEQIDKRKEERDSFSDDFGSGSSRGGSFDEDFDDDIPF